MSILMGMDKKERVEKMTLFYDKRNRENLKKLAIHTKTAALKWYEYCVSNNINILIYETIRTEAKQREYVASGASQTMKSYHRVGQALDFVPVDTNGNCLWSDYGTSEIKKVISYAKSLGFEWGGDWKGLVDKPHLQFNYKGYGTDPFEVTSTPVKHSGNDNVAEFQAWLNKNYGTGLKTDGLYGSKTKTAAIKGIQTELNKKYQANLKVDGAWGPKTKSALHSVRKGDKGNLVFILQGLLYCKGYDPQGLDGVFGDNTELAVLALQEESKISQDGVPGKNTFEKLVA